MAVIPGSLCYHWSGSTGTTDPNTERYVAVWRVKTDDPLDQSQTVLGWFIGNVVARGAAYQYANDAAATTAVANNYAANRVDNSLVSWEVVVTFETPSRNQENEQDSDGNPSQNPMDWRPRIETGTDPYVRIVEHAEYMGGYGAKFNSRYPVQGEARIAPCNSAFTPFTNPPVEEDASASWVRIGWNYPRPVDVEKVQARENLVNSVGFKIDIRGLQMEFTPQEAKIKRVEVIPALANGIYYVQINWLIERAVPTYYRDNTVIKSWDTFRADEGIMARALPGDPDGKGGTVGAVADGAPRTRPLLDVDENVIFEPVPFDGDGQPLKTDSTPAPDEVLGAWRHYKHGDYLDEEYLKDIILPLTP